MSNRVWRKLLHHQIKFRPRILFEGQWGMFLFAEENNIPLSITAICVKNEGDLGIREFPFFGLLTPPTHPKVIIYVGPEHLDSEHHYRSGGFLLHDGFCHRGEKGVREGNLTEKPPPFQSLHCIQLSYNQSRPI